LPPRRVSGLLERDHLPGLPAVESRRDLAGDPSRARLAWVVGEVRVPGGRGLAAMAEDGAQDLPAQVPELGDDCRRDLPSLGGVLVTTLLVNQLAIYKDTIYLWPSTSKK
jgi:hypothetical protein